MTVTTSRGRLGAQVISISEHLRRFFAAPADAGLLVDHVLPNSPASKAGLTTGDVIVKVNGDTIDEAWDIFQALGASKKGDKVSVKIIRNKKPRTLQVTLDDDPSSGPSFRWGGKMANPFNDGGNWKPGELFKDGKNFPFSPMHQGMPPEMQERIRQLEERIHKLEGRKNKGKNSKPGKAAPPRKSGKQLKGARTGSGKSS